MAIRIWKGGKASSENDWGQGGSGGNWVDETGADAAIPADGDVVYIRPHPNGAVYGISASLNQSSIQPAELHIADTYTGPNATIGTATAPLQIGAVLTFVGEQLQAQAATGAGRIHIDYGTDPNTTIVYKTGSSADIGQPACRLGGTNAGNAIYVLGGAVQLGLFPSGATTWATIVSQGGVTTISKGATLTTVKTQGGEIINLGANVTTYTLLGGTTRHYAGTIGTLTSEKGSTMVHMGTGTVTTSTIAGVVDRTQDMRGVTFTTTTGRGGTLKLKGASVTFTNPITGPLNVEY